MFKVFLLTLLVVAGCMALLSVRLFFGRPFVQGHVSQSAALRRRGIHCAQAQDAEARAGRGGAKKRGEKAG